MDLTAWFYIIGIFFAVSTAGIYTKEWWLRGRATEYLMAVVALLWSISYELILSLHCRLLFMDKIQYRAFLKTDWWISRTIPLIIALMIIFIIAIRRKYFMPKTKLNRRIDDIE